MIHIVYRSRPDLSFVLSILYHSRRSIDADSPTYMRSVYSAPSEIIRTQQPFVLLRALEVFFQKFLENLIVEAQTGHQVLYFTVFFFKYLQLSCITDRHAAVPGSPVGERLFSDAVFSTEIDVFCSCFGLIENPDDLFR